MHTIAPFTQNNCPLSLPFHVTCLHTGSHRLSLSSCNLPSHRLSLPSCNLPSHRLSLPCTQALPPFPVTCLHTGSPTLSCNQPSHRLSLPSCNQPSHRLSLPSCNLPSHRLSRPSPVTCLHTGSPVVSGGFLAMRILSISSSHIHTFHRNVDQRASLPAAGNQHTMHSTSIPRASYSHTTTFGPVPTSQREDIHTVKL